MKKKILIIEDEEHLVELLKFRLESCGYAVDVAVDGEDGLEKIDIMKPDLVILDIMMPKMNGYEALKIIRKNDSMKDIPVIILTAYTQKGDIKRALDLGANAFIAKPFEPKVLLTEVKKIIG